MVTEVAAPVVGSDVGIGGVVGSKTVSAADPRPTPKIVMISPGVTVPCEKLAELTTVDISGAGPYTVSCASFDTPPPGVPVVTAMRRTPGFAKSAAGTVTSKAELLTSAEVSVPVSPTDVGEPLSTPAALSVMPAGRPTALHE